MLSIVIIPLVESTGFYFSENNRLYLILEALALSCIVLDLVIKKFAVGYIISPRTHDAHKRRESMFSTMTLVCLFFLWFGIVSERMLDKKYPLLKMFRPVLFMARDSHVQESIASKLHSVR